jgi:GNAT superfamily N-acetyltransferase
VRPFKVLSNGEQFRVTMAALLAYAHAEKRTAPVVVDEFTSVVDRTVARIGSAAIAKAVRRNNQKLVVVTCHEDVEAWLQPEWVYRPAEQSFAWRSVQPRPRVALSIYRVPHGLWSRFRNHHYLTHELNKSAFCFAAVGDFGDDTGPRLVAFDAWLPFFGKLSHGQGRRGHRTGCLPDYQGIGIGNALFSTLASMWAGLGFRAFSGTAHPAEIAARRRNPSWKMTQAPMMRAKGAHTIDAKRASDRLMASFEWQGPAMDKKQATRLLNNWKTDL